MSSNIEEIRYSGKETIQLTKWKVRVGTRVGQMSHLLFNYRICNENLEPIGEELRFKCNKIGVIIEKLGKREGDIVLTNDLLIEYMNCLHNTIMKDLCADCGANINTLDPNSRQRIVEFTSVSMIHSVPELRVSKERAETLGKADEQRLLKDRKLVLLVDLDQTIIHSTNQLVPNDIPNVHHFQLYGPSTQWYHTKFRPHTIQFLKYISKLFELHICTFGARRYAHEIAHLIDPKGLFFPKDRILSRDECFDPTSKTGNMKSLFPCGDSMVCIIDDREDVWNYAPNLVSVKPYIYFRDTGDINAPEKSVSDYIKSHDKTTILLESTQEVRIDVIEDKNKHQIQYTEVNKEILKINETTRENDSKTAQIIDDKIVKTQEFIDEKTLKTHETSDEIIVNLNEKTSETNEINLKIDETIHKKTDKSEEMIENIEKTKETNDEKSLETVEKNEELVEKNEESVEKNEESVEKNEESVEKKEESVEKIEESDVKSDETNNEKTKETDLSEIIPKAEVKNEVITEKDSDSSNNSTEMSVNLTEKNSDKIPSTEENDERKIISDDNDDYLLYLEEILSNIHTEYYKEYDEKIKYKSEDEEIKIPDLKEIIPRVRKCVLRGVNLVFSGVIPTNIPPEKNKLYNIAKNFGATVTPDIVVNGSPKTTHLVAAKWGTVKVNKCVKLRNIHIVSPLWLYSCAERWEKVDERLYPLDKEEYFGDKEKPQIKSVQESGIKTQFMNQSQNKTSVTNTCPVYDPKTGKRIRQEVQTSPKHFLGPKPETQHKSEEREANKVLEKSRQIQPHNMLDFSPLSVFTKNELQSMGKEVDDACSEGDAMSTGNTDSESDIDVEEIEGNIKVEKKRELDSSSDESINDDCPKGWSKNKNKKQKRFIDSVLDLEEGNDSTIDSYDFEKMRGIDGEDSTDNESIGSVDEEMAKAVEREFLN